MTDKESHISLSVIPHGFNIGYFYCRERIIAIRSYSSKSFYQMPGRQAKTLSPADVNDLLLFASCTRNPLRNRVIVLLSAKAGLRAGEIANLTWAMVVGPTGQISGSHRAARQRGKEGRRSGDPDPSGAPLRPRKFTPRGSSLRTCRHP